MKKIANFLLLSVLAALPLRADLLFQDSTNYPYSNGSIEGQGQWYCYYPNTPYLDALVTNNVLLLNTTNHDEVGAPTNGWNNASEYTFASFRINVSQLPSEDGGYFCQFQDNGGSNHCCHVFIDTRGTVVPGTYRLGVANFSTSFGSAYPPVNYPMDLAPGVNYTVVILFDNNPYNTTFAGATLWINPSEQDFQNAANGIITGPNMGVGYVYATDVPISGTIKQNFTITQIGFSPYANAGISNVVAATTFDEVNTTNGPVFGIQPQSTTNYSGNSISFNAVASGVDVSYQWYSSSGVLHDDGVNIIGSTSNILVINDPLASDSYYAVATDTYGNAATSDTAYSTIITTATPPFFPTNVVAVNLTNNVFTSASFADAALGTGPLYYQWYFAPTNVPTTFSPLSGQTSPNLSLSLVDYTFAGQYYVLVSNAVAGGSIAYGPTNTLTELPPAIATLAQLHNLMISLTNQIIANKSGVIYVNTNNVTVAGYVTTYGGFGSSYSEFFLQDALGYGIQVFLGGNGNTNTPPVGTYVTVSGPIEIYHTELEIAPATVTAIVPKPAPVLPIGPKLANAMFNDLATNGLGTNAMNISCSLVTFTNVYIYTNRTGGAPLNGQKFFNDGSTTLFCTVGPYDSVTNANTLEIFQFGYNYPNTYPATSPSGTYSQFHNQAIPTNSYQLTGAYLSFGGTAEILPSRLADYVVTPPPHFSTSIAVSNGVPTLSWPVQSGSTYSVSSSTSLLGPWMLPAAGLAYYPTNGSFIDTNKAAATFYRISSP